MLSLEAICKRFGDVEVLSDISIEIEKGDTVGLVGPNGSGKTALINVVTGMHDADAGRVVYGGRDITGLGSHQISRSGIARTFQNLRLFPRMTVLENVNAAQHGLPSYNLYQLMFGDREVDKNHRQKSEWALEQVGLADERDRLAKTLPLPQLRRLEIARILARDPELVFLDEPAGGMTPAESEAMAMLIADRVTPGRTSIVIEHKMNLIAQVCRRVCVLNAGILIADEKPDVVFTLPQVIEAYLGRRKVSA